MYKTKFMMNKSVFNRLLTISLTTVSVFPNEVLRANSILI